MPEEAAHHEKASHLGSRSNQACNRSQSRGIDIGHPPVKRGCRYLEAKTYQGHQYPHHEKRIVSVGLGVLRNTRQTHGACDSENKTESIKDKGRRKATDQEIFQCHACGEGVGLVNSGQDVEGKCGDFQGNEYHEQVIRSNQQAHACDGKEHERVEFSLVSNM